MEPYGGGFGSVQTPFPEGWFLSVAEGWFNAVI